jgi:hypothetical protein
MPMRTTHLLDRAFLTAHLLTGNAEDAEAAIEEAIKAWDPVGEDERILMRRVIRASLRHEGGYGSYAPSGSLPLELENVLSLSIQLRRCFVLRVLEGLPRETCGELLHLDSPQVDGNTCAALRLLACSWAQTPRFAA